jgi:hypothetical protein
MSPYQPTRNEFETYFEEHEMDFQERDPADRDGDVERWVYAAPLNHGFRVVLQASVTSETGNFRPDNQLTVFVAHEHNPDEYLEEVAGMPLSKSWRDYLETLVMKAEGRIQDLEHCEACALPMLKYNDYAGEFYACVSMDCNNTIEIEPLDRQVENDAQ